MCDTMVIVRPGRVLFAKNSDRDPNEAQRLEWRPRQSHPAGATLRCTWITIPQVRETFATLISRPYWMWGAEMGANEHGVAMGNEAVFTREPLAATGLTGMDLVRLALERAATARAACETVIGLLESHGQGGGCGHENRRFTYHNSFIAADAETAFVLETAGRYWAMEEVVGVRAISNTLGIPGFADRHAERLKTTVGGGRTRCARTTRLLSPQTEMHDLFAVLRDHGGRPAPAYGFVHGGLGHPCVHAGGLVAASQTVASWVSDIRPGAARHWVTATAAPCTSLFKPVYVEHPLQETMPEADLADDSLWWRHERFHRLVARNPAAHAPAFVPERDALEAGWLQDPPESALAFAAHQRLLTAWTTAARGITPTDTRPWWVRRYWTKRNRRAGITEHWNH